MLSDAELQQMLADAERIEALRGKATPGTWDVKRQYSNECEDVPLIVCEPGADRGCGVIGEMWGAPYLGYKSTLPNASFIAATRTDPSAANVRKLVEEVRRLRAKGTTVDPQKRFWFSASEKFAEYAMRFPRVAKDAAEEIIFACHIHGVPVPEHLKAYEEGGAT